MRILVCGCRDWSDEDAIERELFDVESNDNVLIHGGARGADTIAAGYAEKLGWQVLEWPADWKRFGRSAGPRRNLDMLREGKPHWVYAFWDGKSRGTLDMIQQAVAAGVRVQITPAREPMPSWVVRGGK